MGAVANGGVGIGAATRFRARFTTDHTAAPSGLVLNTSGRWPADRRISRWPSTPREGIWCSPAEQGHKPLKQSFTGVGKGHTLILTVPTLDGRIAPTSFAATIAARPGGRRWLLTPPSCPSSGHWRAALYERVPCR